MCIFIMCMSGIALCEISCHRNLCEFIPRFIKVITNAIPVDFRYKPGPEVYSLLFMRASGLQRFKYIDVCAVCLKLIGVTTVLQSSLFCYFVAVRIIIRQLKNQISHLMQIGMVVRMEDVG